MKRNWIDSEKPFDFGETSDDYAKYRDIYPDSKMMQILRMNSDLFHIYSKK